MACACKNKKTSSPSFAVKNTTHVESISKSTPTGRRVVRRELK